MATPWEEIRHKHFRWWMVRRRFRVWRYRRELTRMDKANAHVTDEMVLAAMEERPFIVIDRKSSNILGEFTTHDEADALIGELAYAGNNIADLEIIELEA